MTHHERKKLRKKVNILVKTFNRYCETSDINYYEAFHSCAREVYRMCGVGKEIENYFETCVAYWMRSGDSKKVATVKALWWDCVEVWNFDKSWNADKIEFINRYRHYKPYDPVPEAKFVEAGNA